MNRETYTVEECAKILGIARLTAYRAVRNREIPALKIGRRYLIPKSALDQYLRGAADKVA